MQKKKKALKITGISLLSLLVLLALWVASTFIVFNEDIPNSRITLQNTESDYASYIDESNYEETLSDVVLPMIDQYKKTGTFKGFDNNDLYYETYIVPDAKASVVISHGFTESSQHYKEVIYYFIQRKYSVFIMDHRGHGYSYRGVSDSSLVHITDFNDYIRDFTCFIDNVVKKNSDDEPKLLYAHSMGGAIATGYLENHPDLFNAAVLTTPMLDVETGSIPQRLSKAIANLYTWTGNGTSYILGQGPYVDEYDITTTSTSSQARFDYYYHVVKADDALKTNGGSFSWLQQALTITKELTSKENASKVSTPILMFEAENDNLVNSNGYYRFVKYAKNTTLTYVPNAKHTLFKSENDILIPYFNQILSFFDQYDL